VNAKVPLGPKYPEPFAFDWTSTLAPVFAALVANGLRGLLLTRAWHSLDNACALSPTFDEDGMRERINC